MTNANISIDPAFLTDETLHEAYELEIASRNGEMMRFGELVAGKGDSVTTIVIFGEFVRLLICRKPKLNSLLSPPLLLRLRPRLRPHPIQPSHTNPPRHNPTPRPTGSSHYHRLWRPHPHRAVYPRNIRHLPYILRPLDEDLREIRDEEDLAWVYRTPAVLVRVFFWCFR
jgi:hypothetical protein